MAASAALNLMKFPPLTTGIALALTTITGASVAHAQAPGVVIEVNNPRTGNAALLEKAKIARDSGKLLNIEQVNAMIKTPLNGKVDLPRPNTETLPAREVAARSRKGSLQLGWYYRCQHCDNWHVNLASAYAVAKDAIVTCAHCIVPGAAMREGYLIAVDHTGNVVPITGVIARNQTMDAAILRVEGGNFTPLPLNDQVAQGDSAFCLSDPLGQEGYFSAGIINRFYWRSGEKGDTGSVEKIKAMRLNVSTDWAPGSSGAPVLDAAANVIGHVSTISPMNEQTRPGPRPAGTSGGTGAAPGAAPGDSHAEHSGGATLITLHDAIPARSVMLLAQSAAQSEPKAPESRPAADGAPADANAGSKTEPKADAEPEAPKTAPADAKADGKADEKGSAKEDEKEDAQPGGLKIGDAAPKLAPGKWIQGEPVQEFEPGKVYLIEFWATWCGPCIRGIPHLNALHQKFADKGLVVVGQNVWDPNASRVPDFVKQQGEKMTYRVAVDKLSTPDDPSSGAMAQTWMKAAGLNGIPAAFLVDKTGHIAWIGHPASINDAMIESLLAGTFDTAKAKKEAGEEAKMEADRQRFSRGMRKAMAEKDWGQAMKLIDELEATLPADQKLMAASPRLMVIIQSKNGAAANELASKLASTKEVPAEMANAVAWKLLTTDGLEGIDYNAVERLARHAVDLSKGDDQRAPTLDTLARAVFLAGRKDEAIKIQQQAIDAADSDELKQQLTATLEAYKAGKVPPAQ